MKKPTKAEFNEGPRALDDFERTMKKLFQVPKSHVQRHPIKKRKPKGKT